LTIARHDYGTVEALGNDDQPLPGRSFEDCDALVGDQMERAVTWGGETDIGHNNGAPITLRFRARYASLFSIRFR
jgi:hypothetical protein